MNNQTKTQENVKKALAKQTLGLPLTPHEHALVTLYGQSPVQQKENKPEFVEKYLKPLVVALGVGVVNVVYRGQSTLLSRPIPATSTPNLQDLAGIKPFSCNSCQFLFAISIHS